MDGSSNTPCQLCWVSCDGQSHFMPAVLCCVNIPSLGSRNNTSYFMGSMDGAVVRALASHQCGPGSIPVLGVICGLSLLLVLVLAPRGFSPGTPVFHFLKNQHFQVPILSGLFSVEHFVMNLWLGRSHKHSPRY